jgi:hypothetical protein
MSKHPDPFAIPTPGFEPYAGPNADDFQPMDSQSVDLGTFLRSEEVQQFVRKATGKTEPGSETLPTGAHLIRRGDDFELLVPTTGAPGSYRIYRGRSRAEVMSKSRS